MNSKCVQKRYAANEEKYDAIEKCTNIATLTSTVKLFLREMPDPLITQEMVNYVKTANMDLSGKGDQQKLISQLKKALSYIDKLAYQVLHYILQHAKRVADVEGKKDKSIITLFHTV